MKKWAFFKRSGEIGSRRRRKEEQELTPGDGRRVNFLQRRGLGDEGRCDLNTAQTVMLEEKNKIKSYFEKRGIGGRAFGGKVRGHVLLRNGENCKITPPRNGSQFSINTLLLFQRERERERADKECD